MDIYLYYYNTLVEIVSSYVQVMYNIVIVSKQLDISSVVPSESTPPLASDTSVSAQQHSSPAETSDSAALLPGEPGPSGASGGGDGALAISSDQLSSTQQAMVATMEAAGVVRETTLINRGWPWGGGARESIEFGKM